MREAGEGGDGQWGKDQKKEIARRRANGDPVDKNLVGERLPRIVREISPKLPIFIKVLVLIFILALFLNL